MFGIVARNLVSLCLLIVIGFIAGKTKIISEKLNSGLSDILLKIALPCTIIMSMQRPFSQELLVEGGIVFAISNVIYFASLGVGIFLCKITKTKMPQQGVWIFSLMFPNVGYMGFPVLNAVYGEDVLFFVSMNNVVFNVLSSTLGVVIIKRGADAILFKGNKNKQKEKKDLNLLPIATALGFILFLFSIQIPQPIAEAIRMGGNMTTPLSMIIIGVLLSKSGLGKIFTGSKEYLLISFRLLVLPIATFFIISPFIENVLIVGVLVFLTAMPVSAVTAIFSSKYESDAHLGSKLVALSTILSLITLPLIALLL